MAIEAGCVEPALRARGPDARAAPRRRGADPPRRQRPRRWPAPRSTPTPQLTVQLSNGVKLPAEVKKFSAPLLLDATGWQPAPDSGRDLALLRSAGRRRIPRSPSRRATPKIGDAVHILGFPGVVLSHELLNQSVVHRGDGHQRRGVRHQRRTRSARTSCRPTRRPRTATAAVPRSATTATVLGVMTFISLSAQGAVVQGFNFLIPARDVLKFLAGHGGHEAGRRASSTTRGSRASPRCPARSTTRPPLAKLTRGEQAAAEAARGRRAR